MATYLVTGAAGFIGSKVSELLLADGHNVVGIDNLNEAYDVRLKQWRLQQLNKTPGFLFHQLDICEKNSLKAMCGELPQIEAVINLAARAGVRASVENPWVYVDTNVTGTVNLLEFCRETGVRKFILASTSSLYGAHNKMPYQEDADTNRPLSPYSASKKAAEAMSHAYHYLHGIDVTVFRYFTVYGPGGRPDMSLFRFVQWISEGRPVRIFGDGHQTRDFTYIDDIARGTIAGLKSVGYEIINLGCDKPLDLLGAVRIVERLLGKKANLVFSPAHSADAADTWADITRAKTILNWSPQTPYEKGIEQLVTWYLENRSWAKDIETSDNASAAVAD